MDYYKLFYKFISKKPQTVMSTATGSLIGKEEMIIMIFAYDLSVSFIQIPLFFYIEKFKH